MKLGVFLPFLYLFRKSNQNKLMFSGTNKVQNLAKKLSDNKFTKMTKLANVLKNTVK